MREQGSLKGGERGGGHASCQFYSLRPNSQKIRTCVYTLSSKAYKISLKESVNYQTHPRQDFIFYIMFWSVFRLRSAKFPLESILHITIIKGPFNFKVWL